MIKIKDIIDEAFGFECCPHCGNPDLKVSNHYCEKCKERIVEPDDAYWFALYLEKKYKLNLKGGLKNE